MGEVKRCPWPFVHLLGGADERDVRDCREKLVGSWRESGMNEPKLKPNRDATVTPNLIL